MTDEKKYEIMKLPIRRDTMGISNDNYVPPISMIAQLSAELRDATRKLANVEHRNAAMTIALNDHKRSWKAVGVLIDESFKTELTDDSRILEFLWDEVKEIRDAALHNFHEGM